MKTNFFLLIFCSLFAVNILFSQEVDNEELIELYRTDQADRSVSEIDWSIVSINDSIRQDRILQMLDSNLVVTSNDHANAAMIFQHGEDSTAYRMVVQLMTKAIELNPNRSKWLLAAGIDRELMSRDEPQVYGTQYRKYKDNDGEWGPWVLYKIDTTVITDEERQEYGVQTLEQQKTRLISMNSRSIKDLQGEGMTNKEIIQLCKNEKKKEVPSTYISEISLNNFGYSLMGSGSEKDALKIFKLNTKFYPDGFNTFDSLGECYMKMGKVKKGLKAYKKSLELNPNNSGAKAIISKHNK